DDLKGPFLQEAFSVVKSVIVCLLHEFVKLLIRPIFPVLGIGDGLDLRDVWVVTPHLATDLAVQFTHAVCFSGKAKSRQTMVEDRAIHSRQALYLSDRMAVEKAHLVQKVIVVLFIASFFGR